MSITSIHLQKFPKISSIPFSQEIINQMEFVRKICNAGLSIRKKNNIKARLPLNSITISGECFALNQELQTLIQDELNVKNVTFENDISKFDCTKIINIDASKVAKRIGKDFQTVLKQAKQGIYNEVEDGIEISGHNIFKGEYEIQIKLNSAEENYTSLDGKFLIILDITITKELEMEGVARDFIRMVQNNRKEKNLELSQKISLILNFSQESVTKEAIFANIEYIKEQVLATDVKLEQISGTVFNEELSFEILPN